MKNLKIAYLYPAYSNKSGDYTNLLNERVGDGQGNFHWLNENNKNWYIDTQENPDLLFFNGKYYKYGKDGYRKSTLNSLELINKPVETTNRQPKCKCVVCEEEFTPICSDKCGSALI